MAMELKAALPSHLSQPNDPQRARAIEAWSVLLDGIHALAKERKRAQKIAISDEGEDKDTWQPKVFISYAWPPAGVARDTLQTFLKRLQDDLKRAGIQVFLDVRGMQGNMDVTMREHLEESDFVMPIFTPHFLKRVQEAGAEPNNLQFEFNLMLEKTRDNPPLKKANPHCLLPILYEGEFKDVVLQEPLKPLAKNMVYTLLPHTNIDPYLVGVSDPLGLIPVIHGIPFDDPAYNKLLLTWTNSRLIQLPQSLHYAIERRGLMAELFYKKTGELVSVQVVEGVEGVGKTQFALIYANQMAYQKEFVYWIAADKPNFSAEWCKLGNALGLDLKGLTEEEQKERIRLALSNKPNWLIVLDNLESIDMLQDLLPQNLYPTQQVLITTRSKQWGEHPVLSFEPFTPEESHIYFSRRVKYELWASGSKKLAQALGHLPLALSQAVTHMQAHSQTAKEYYQSRGLDAVLPQAAAAAAPSPALAYIPNLFAPAIPNAAAIEAERLELEVQLLQLQKAYEAHLKETAIVGDDDYPAVTTQAGLNERIQTLEKLEAKFKEKFEDKREDEYKCLKTCRAALELSKKIEVIERKLEARSGLPFVRENTQANEAKVADGGQIGSRLDGDIAHFESELNANRSAVVNNGHIGAVIEGAAGRVRMNVNANNAQVDGGHIGLRVVGGRANVRSTINAAGATVASGGRIGGSYRNNG